MMKYEKYKPSEIDWIGNVPNHWEIIRIKDVFNQISKIGSEIGVNNYIPLENIESQTGKLIQRISNENNEVTNLFKKGDILVNKLRPYLAKVYLPEFDGGVSGEVIVFRVSNVNQKKISSKYYFYRFLSRQFIEKINSITDGVKMPRTNPTKINCLEIAIPPLSEQTAIAEYLDAKTQAIDKKINLLTKKAETYKELRKSMINDAVCKGLDKSVKLKESGIDWIGKIPEHWELRMFKQISYMKGRIGWQGLKFSEFSDDVNQPYLITGMNFKGGKIRWEEVYHISEERYNEAPEIQLKVNDILMTKDGTIGKLLFVDYLPGKASLNSHLLVLRPLKNKYHAKYLYYQLESESFIGHIEHNKYGTTFYGLTQEAMGRFITILPLLSEQTAIANYLDEKTQKIDAIVSNIGKQIDTLKELRKTLINDVVTGKIKVSEPLIDID
jgi:type I restriction enzyme S subunit